MSHHKTNVITLGCRLNSSESEVIKNILVQSGLDDTIVVNTCAVTKEAERQARQTVRKVIRQRPNSNVIVTGCAAQLHPKQFADIEGVSKVLGNKEKLDIINYTNNHNNIIVSDIMRLEEAASHLAESFQGKARAFLEIQNGCNHRCTFCIIPFARGNNRSVRIDDIVRHTKKLVENGYKEIVLTGVDITDYGQDISNSLSLGVLIKYLLKSVPELKRLRLSSVDVAEVNDDLLELMANEERIMPHIHLSLQSGDNMILKRMKRRHLQDDIINFCQKLRSKRSDVVFGADIIAGFPTETDQMFNNSLNLIDDMDITYLHVFPYSEREGTPAARMPQVPHNIRKARALSLRRLGESKLKKFLQSRIGQEESVLVETPTTGRTSHYAPIAWNIPAIPGEILDILVLSSDLNTLHGKPLI